LGVAEFFGTGGQIPLLDHKSFLKSMQLPNCIKGFVVNTRLVKKKIERKT